MVKTIIDVTNLSISYVNHVHVIENVSFSIDEGDFVALIGPNGGGKTTLLKAMLGLIKPCCGSIRLFETPISEFKGWNNVGYVPQDVQSISKFIPISVYEFLITGIRSKASNIRNVIERISRMTGLKDVIDLSLSELSGGFLQRVYIARALIDDPCILFLDEPLAFVDQPSQSSIYKLLIDLNERKGKTIVITSHDIATVTKKVNKLICINKRLFYHGDPSSFFEDESLCKLYDHHVVSIIHKHESDKDW